MKKPCRIDNINKPYVRILLFLFSMFSGHSQTFPVQATPQVVPPYSLKLSEYGTGTSEKLVLNLLLTDISEFNRQVRLKLIIENNNGLSVRNTEVVVGARPIFLDGGTPLRLGSVDLQPYFSLQNLQGIAPQQYNRPFPEGLYRFCFEVYDAISGRQVSGKSCATAYLVLNDPPFLNIPNKGEQVTVREPQNIVFQWTPRHLNATNVEYEFTLVELWDNGMDPQAAFLAGRPLYRATTFANTLLYGPAETGLLPNKRYAWRVRAVVNDGIGETAVFKNNGYSEVHHFTYADTCKEPGYVLAEPKGPTGEKVLWQGAGHERFNVQYRKAGVENGAWFDAGTVNEFVSIHNLEPGTEYGFRVGGQCIENGAYTYSQVYTFTTPTGGDDGTAAFNCGITPEIVITNQKPLGAMVANDVFTAGDFPVTLKEVNGSNGTFSGWGYIVVPYLEDTKVKVSFDNIRVNSDHQLLEGVVVTGHDRNWGGVDDMGNELEVLAGLGDALVQIGGTAVTASVDAIKGLADKVKGLITKDGDITEEQKAVLEEKLETLVASKEAYDNATTEGERAIAEEVYKETRDAIVDDIEIPETDTEADVDDTQDGAGGESESDEGGIAKIWFAGDNNMYGNGETITVVFDSKDLNLAFDLRNYPKETKTFKWQLIHEGIDRTIDVKNNDDNLYNFGLNLKGMSGNITLKVTYDDKEIKVILSTEEEEFELKELYASDDKNSIRLAKSGEILYLVKAKGITSTNDRNRKVNYSLTTQPKTEEINLNSIMWNYSDINGVRKYDKDKINIYRNLWERDTKFTTIVEAGYPIKTSKNIDVLFVDGTPKQFDFMPPGVSALLKGNLQKIEDKLKILDKINNTLGLKQKTKFKIDPIRISGQKYNEEDARSRLYKAYEQGSVTAGVKAEMVEVSFTHPVLKLAERTGIFKAGAYILFKVQAQVKGGVKRYKYVEKNNYEGTNPFIKIVSKGCIEAGLRAELLVLENQIEFDIKGYTEGCLAGEYKYSIKDEKFSGNMYIPPVLLVAHAKIKSKGVLKFELLDWRGKIEITDRIEL